jgi:hypothetical protein
MKSDVYSNVRRRTVSGAKQAPWFHPCSADRSVLLSIFRNKAKTLLSEIHILHTALKPFSCSPIERRGVAF